MGAQEFRAHLSQPLEKANGINLSAAERIRSDVKRCMQGRDISILDSFLTRPLIR